MFARSVPSRLSRRVAIPPDVPRPSFDSLKEEAPSIERAGAMVEDLVAATGTERPHREGAALLASEPQ